MTLAQEQTTIRTSLPLFAAWLQDRDRSERTVHAYTDALDRFCHWLDQHHAATTIQEITIRDGTLFRDFLQERGLSAATINHLLAALAAWGSWAETTGHRRDNPFANLRRVKRTQHQKSPKSLDHRQQAALLRETTHATNPQRAETILTILLQTGLRISELCALQWGDLYLTERSASLVVRHGKGNQERHIPFSITLRRALWRWAVECYELAQDESVMERQRWNQHHATQLMMWIALHPNEPVIASQKGGHLQARAIQRVIEGLAQRAQLPWVTPHTLRHTYATDLLRHGAQLTDVQVLLGHASITTTSIYTQPRPDHLEQATDRLAWE